MNTNSQAAKFNLCYISEAKAPIVWLQNPEV